MYLFFKQNKNGKNKIDGKNKIMVTSWEGGPALDTLAKRGQLFRGGWRLDFPW